VANCFIESKNIQKGGWWGGKTVKRVSGFWFMVSGLEFFSSSLSLLAYLRRGIKRKER
jgi:hypothetical protein